MVKHKTNFKETEIVLMFDKKSIESDLVEIKNLIKRSKDIPFHSTYVSIPKVLEMFFLNSIQKIFKPKSIGKTKDFLIIEF